MIRIQGNMNRAKAMKQVEKRLECFSLDLNKDVVATTTDGASFTVKFEKKTSPHCVTCYAHTIRDVLYKILKCMPSEPVSD